MNEKKGISTLDFFCIGFGAIVGVGWAINMNRWMNNGGGPIPTALGYLLCLLIMVPIALCYCELCGMFPVAGGGVAYAHKAFGERVAFASGWAGLGAFITIIPWEAIYVVDMLNIFIPQLKEGEPLYRLAGTDIYPGHLIFGTVFSVILFYINYKGTQTSAVVQRILCLALTGSGILTIIFCAFRFNAANLQPVYANLGSGNHSTFMGGVFYTLATIPFYLSGFETIPQAIEGADSKQSSVGKTVVLSVSLAAIFYMLLFIFLGAAVPWQEYAAYPVPAGSILIRNVYPGILGKVMYVIILIGGVAGLLSTWNGFMMASSQLIMSLGRASMLPHGLAKQHPKYGTPVRALVICLVFSIIGPFLGMGLIDPLTSFAAGAFVVSWLISATSLVRLRNKQPNLNRPYKIPGGKVTATYSALTMAALLALLLIPSSPAYMGTTAIILFICWMVLGVILFAANTKSRNRFTPEERSSHLFDRA